MYRLQVEIICLQEKLFLFMHLSIYYETEWNEIVKSQSNVNLFKNLNFLFLYFKYSLIITPKRNY